MGKGPEGLREHKGAWRLTEDGHVVARGLWLSNSGKREADLAPVPWAALD